MDVKQYAEELLKAAGVTDDASKQAVLNVFSNEAAAKYVNDSTLRQQDYSRNMDALKADKDKWQKFYQDTLTWKATEEQRLADLDARVKAYEAAYPDEGNGRQPVIQPVQGDFISKKDFDQKLAEMGTQFVGLAKVMGSLASRHVLEFKEPLDTEELAKVAAERGLTAQQAYDAMVQPKREASQKASFEAQLKAAREEGAREFATKHKIPADPGQREFHNIFDRKVGGDGAVVTDYQPNSQQLTPAASRSLRDDFVTSWNSTRPGNTSAE